MPRVKKQLSRAPVERALDVIGGRWKLLILWYVLDEPKQLSELKRLLPAITQKVLVEQLRHMEADGIVARAAYADVPARVTYSATSHGRALRPVIELLCAWGRSHDVEWGGIDARDIPCPESVR